MSNLENIEKHLISIKRLLVFLATSWGLIILFWIGAWVYHSLNNNWPESFLTKANILYENNQIEELKTYSNQRVQEKPFDYNGYWYLGLALQYEGKYELAIKNYEKALSLTQAESLKQTLRKNIQQCKDNLTSSSNTSN